MPSATFYKNIGMASIAAGVIFLTLSWLSKQ